ncbi:YjjG family noncanonical pyrimidine nucleotidase [Duganella sp. sic0402]|uniref:YjjG family noncanonical pyrimidine nucleotidase n=1 Tax=Duganella sp. sic0402 TaxID=2854786 RepID=UPI001C46C6EE|nr:YjjG family noncanonical pyrimidine nucleotidase [Duganella sp. sic0402]MBV7534300.1 YjjG family noncanonical pyrimidine nucleotidase [Duganella sp. sic0402]
MRHQLFLFDLDDTLLDFKASEQLSFVRTLQALGISGDMTALFLQYQTINLALWRAFETGSVSKDFLKVERFRKTFMENGLELDPEAASRLYLESLSDTVVLIDGAVQLCATLAAAGEVGIITNGVEAIQNQRILKSGLRDYISFVATSEACGYAKPDVRFFEYAAQMARPFVKEQAIIVGDRLDADILGANRYGIESCWFNPERVANTSEAVPTYEASSLHDIIRLLA